MKATEYVQLYQKYLREPPAIWKDAPPDYKADTQDDKEVDAVIAICMDLFKEVMANIKLRKVSTARGVLAAFKEQNLKWKAIHRQLGNPNISADSFRLVAMEQYPTLAITFSTALV